jgi:beta-glucanase (GH16 family)
MKRFLLFFLFIGFSLFVNAQFIDPDTPPNTFPVNSQINSNWVLHFSDEFNQDSLNSNKWSKLESPSSRAARPDLGIDDWFWKEENVSLDSGYLVLDVIKEDTNTMYCGAVNSNNKFETTYGYFEVRMKIAEAAKGTHTAFWFQGDAMSQIDGTGNDGAEIDVFESAWLGDYTKSVIHIDGYGASHQADTRQYNTPGIHNNFHIWGVFWTADSIKIYYDNSLKVVYANTMWIPQNDEYIYLSDGASFGLSGNYFTSQPIGYLTSAYVDYIRMWKTGGMSEVIEEVKNTKVIRIIDVLGRESEQLNNQPLFYIYDDGTVEKKIILE